MMAMCKNSELQKIKIEPKYQNVIDLDTENLKKEIVDGSIDTEPRLRSYLCLKT